jgi:hypothetical protein
VLLGQDVLQTLHETGSEAHRSKTNLYDLWGTRVSYVACPVFPLVYRLLQFSLSFMYGFSGPVGVGNASGWVLTPPNADSLCGKLCPNWECRVFAVTKVW